MTTITPPPLLGIIDYGMGNLHSVTKSLQRLGGRCRRLCSGADVRRWQDSGGSALVLPGVGAFDPAMAQLAERDLIQPIGQWVHRDRPLLGICLGLQLLFSGSAEGRLAGLNLVPGRVEPLKPTADEPVPHMGWQPLVSADISPLFPSQEEQWVYFVHSYGAVPEDANLVAAHVMVARQPVTAAIAHGALVATQFHPEKSGPCGQRILARWLKHLPG
ncbi:MAG: imidazole glycerol phosphate synthase subunit HisH [Cyanobacteria bacterium MAG CAR3_bin_5]|nr:imidazole glycerol phosphate synthase subunit HisH [Cyanobacteria bacterium MAG CAR4_bin_6]MCY4173705.1 imidazole glycerol phosphate synthase subunit HisH [Cyanobacteria bacterium MAG CAR3_bin_5]